MDEVNSGQDDSADVGVRQIPDPDRIGDRSEFTAYLSMVRERACKTVRTIANEVGQPSATIGGYFGGQHLPPLRQTDLFRNILRCLGINDDEEIERWVIALDRVRRKPGPRPADFPTPYRGLESFGTDDARWFFGREDLTDTLVQRLAHRIADRCAEAVIVVVGASGVGKSSLLCATLIPAALCGRLDAVSRRPAGAVVPPEGLLPGRPWRCVLLTPGKDPIGALAGRLGEQTGADRAELELALRDDNVDWLALVGDCGGLVVVVDQFEEVFTDCRDEAERQAFFAALRSASAPAVTHSGAVAVVLGLRSDFYGVAAEEPLLVPLLQDNQLLVGPLKVEQLRRAIVEPARVAGFAVEEELVALLMDECVPGGSRPGVPDPGALPLLSHALLETWRRARKGRLTVADYRATGGIAGAVQQTAERLFNEMTADEQTLARRVFLRLVHVGTDTVVTRRRIERSELPDSDSDEPGLREGRDFASSQAGLVGRVVDRFVTHRLLTVQTTTVEISHEALVRAWPRLSDWVEADLEGLRVRRRLSETARLWAEADRDPAVLLRAARLEAAQTWAASLDHRDDLNQLEQSYLQASGDLARAEQRAVHRRTRRLQAVMAVVAALATVAGALAIVAVRARNSAVRTRDQALSRQVAIEATNLRGSDPSLSMQLALAAYRVAPTVEARSALLDSSTLPSVTRLLGQPGATALAVTDDGRTMAVSRSIDGSVQLFSLAKAEPVKQGLLVPPRPGSQLFALAFNPNGSLLATGGTDNVVRLWDVTDPGRPRLLPRSLGGFGGAVESIAFSPDGQTLIAGGATDAVLQWDVTNPAEPNVLPPLVGLTGSDVYNTVIQTVSFSPDGKVIAAGVDGTVQLWIAARAGTQPVTQQPVTQMALGDTTVDSVAFSPDGRVLAAGSKDKTVRLWDVTDPTAPTPIGAPLTGFGSWVNTVAFSPDGRTLAAGSSDNTVRFWDVDGWRPLATTLTHPQPVTNIAFMPDSQEILTSAEDGTARVWSLTRPLISGPTDTIFGLSYASNTLAVAPNHGDTRIELWDTSDRQHPRLLGGIQLPLGIGALDGTTALSPDGKLLAAGTDTGEVQLFDVASPTQPEPIGPALTGPTKLIEQVAFSATGHLLAAGSDDGTVRIWDIGNAARPIPLSTVTGPASLVLGINFDPDGHLLAAASADKTVRLWDITNPRDPIPLATLTGFDNYALTVAFSPDGHLMAAGSADRTVRLWDITNPHKPQQLGPPITGPTDYVYNVVFAPDGHTLAAAVTNGTVWEWDITNPKRSQVIATLTASTGPLFVVAYSPDGRTLAAAGSDMIVYLWDTDLQQIASKICSITGDAITPQEWAQYLPGQPYKSLCGTHRPQ
jgi:WD40 repeat protein